MLKPGVDLRGIKPQAVMAYAIASLVYARHKAVCVVTSGTDGTHGPNSLHYSGNALDLRTNMFTKEEQDVVHRDLVVALGAQFDVVLESDHIHVEFDPKDTPKEPEI